MQDHQQPNPFLSIPNPFEEYQQSLNDLEKNPLHFEFDRLCYEVFIASEHGKNLYKLMQERMLLPSYINPSSPQAPQIAFYWASFYDAIRGMYQAALHHQQRILA